jgi:hypothetical protein
VEARGAGRWAMAKGSGWGADGGRWRRPGVAGDGEGFEVGARTEDGGSGPGWRVMAKGSGWKRGTLGGGRWRGVVCGVGCWAEDDRGAGRRGFASGTIISRFRTPTRAARPPHPPRRWRRAAPVPRARSGLHMSRQKQTASPRVARGDDTRRHGPQAPNSSPARGPAARVQSPPQRPCGPHARGPAPSPRPGGQAPYGTDRYPRRDGPAAPRPGGRTPRAWPPARAGRKAALPALLRALAPSGSAPLSGNTG